MADHNHRNTQKQPTMAPDGVGIGEMWLNHAQIAHRKRSAPRQRRQWGTKMTPEPGAATPPHEASLQSLKSWVAVIIGIVIAYQIATLGHQGLWFDEIVTVMVSRPERSLTAIFQSCLRYDTNPPLHFVLIHFWQLVAPRGDWSMRVPGLFFYILTIAVAAL
jgi:hypothetical protein